MSTSLNCARSSRRRVIMVVILVAVLAAILMSTILRRPPSARPNVLWITMDSLRADHLGCMGYDRAHTPAMDALARGSVLFRQTISQSTYTHISVPSMITGKYPYFLDIRTIGPDLDSSHVTLAEALAKAGYFTCGILEDWPEGFYQGLEEVSVEKSSTPHRTQQCLAILEQLDGRPFFIWLYYWDPHAPYTPPVEFMRKYEPGYTLLDGIRAYRPDLRDATGLYGGSTLLLGRLNQGKIVLTPDERDHLINLYDAEVAFVDANIQQVLDRLKELDLWENTLVILNADHGEVFGEHGKYYHGHSIYEQQVRIPLIIKPPGSHQAGKVIEGPVRNLDIAPTIMDYCNIHIPEGVQGESLRSFMEGESCPDLPACMETRNVQTLTHLLGYRTDRHKLIYDLSNGVAELYDLAEDPEEGNNLLAEEAVAHARQSSGAEIEARLQKKLLTALGVEEVSALRLREESTSMDPQTRGRLKALGYIY